MATVEELMNVAESAADVFQPYFLLSEQGDALTVYLRPDPDYSKRLCDHITLLLSLDSKEIVGCRIKGIHDIIRDLPNFIGVNHEGVRLSVVFLPFLAAQKDEQARRDLNELARRVCEEDMLLPV